MTGSNGEGDGGGARRTGPERVIVYTKRGCGWCYEVLSLLDSRGIGYEEREVYSNPRYFDEMVEKSGQWLAPVVEIDGHLLIDTDAYEVGRYLAKLAERPAAEHVGWSLCGAGGSVHGDAGGYPLESTAARVLPTALRGGQSEEGGTDGVYAQAADTAECAAAGPAPRQLPALAAA